MTRYAANDTAAPPSEHRDTGGRVVGHNGLRPQREHAEDDPRRGQRQPRGADRPALPGLELGSGAGVLAKELRQRAQQPAEVGAADLARDAHRLDDPVADRVGERRLQPVQALAEAGRSRGSRRQTCGTPAAAGSGRGPRSATIASGSDIPARTAEARLSTTSGHSSRSSVVRCRRAIPDQRERRVAREAGEREPDRGGVADAGDHDEGDGGRATRQGVQLSRAEPRRSRPARAAR